MKTMKYFYLLCSLLLLASCADNKTYTKGVYLLLDTSGTYTNELDKAKQIIKYMLGTLNPGDTFAVARIDSGSFSEKDIIAKATFDARPSVANSQKRVFSKDVDSFITEVKSSPYTDISGGLLQAVEFLQEAGSGNNYIMVFSDMKEDLPEGFVRNRELLNFNGYTVLALNVTKLRTDNRNPQEYIERVTDWQHHVESTGGVWRVVNDLDREEGLLLASSE